MTVWEAVEQAQREQLSPWACRAEESRGRARPVPPCPMRTDFQRDVDRIVHSKAFRRLMHKTQVFLAPEGDHYRTRMTHTLEVARVARTMARGLRLNEIMPGGFEHNVQSLRVVERLEQGGAGLNLTWEVRNAIRCHTGAEEAATLEGRLIRLADRIAYINHDIDDAIRGGVLYPLDVPLELSQVLGFSHGERIDTLVSDVIEQSRDKGEICQSEPCRRAMEELRAFLFARVYHSPLAKGEERKAQDMLRFLFEYYRREADRLPGEFQEIRALEGTERAVCDYIAGMTDKYAVEQFRTLAIPRAWAVK